MAIPGLKGKNAEEFFVHAMEGLFNCIHLPAVQSEAESYIKKVLSALFESDMCCHQSRPPNTRVPQSTLLARLLDAIPHALTREQPAQIEKAKAFIASIIEDLVQMKSQSGITAQDILPALHRLANCFTSLCLDDSWVRKTPAAMAFA